MATPTEIPPKKSPVLFSEQDVEDLILAQQDIYALDDAIANQTQLRRPDRFIIPLSRKLNQAIENYNRITARMVKQQESTTQKPT